jgi:hypothetical protein
MLILAKYFLVLFENPNYTKSAKIIIYSYVFTTIITILYYTIIFSLDNYSIILTCLDSKKSSIKTCQEDISIALGTILFITKVSILFYSFILVILIFCKNNKTYKYYIITPIMSSFLVIGLIKLLYYIYSKASFSVFMGEIELLFLILWSLIPWVFKIIWRGV